MNLPVGIVAVDRQYDIRHINATARDLLGIPSIEVGDDLIRLARTLPPAELRASLDAGLRGEATTRIYAVKVGDAVRHLEIAVHPGDVESVEGGDTVVAIITDLTDTVTVGDSLERSRETQRGAALDLPGRIARLMKSNTELTQSNEDLTLRNMDLQRTNEELRISSEEVQAAAEEIKRLNEDLSATNEELERVNEELRATLEELNAMSRDLQARRRRKLAE